MEIRASDEDVQKYLIGHMTRLPSCVSRNLALQEKIKAEILKTVDGMYVSSNAVGGGIPKLIRFTQVSPRTASPGVANR